MVLACHSDQALSLLCDPTPAEREVLGAIPYQENLAVLHTDTSVLPERRQSLVKLELLHHRGTLPASGAHLRHEHPPDDQGARGVLRDPEPAGRSPRKRRSAGTVYHHPQYTLAAPAAQQRHSEISGRNRTHYCGAYWGYGFHEDGVKSALSGMQVFRERVWIDAQLHL